MFAASPDSRSQTRAAGATCQFPVRRRPARSVRGRPLPAPSGATAIRVLRHGRPAATAPARAARGSGSRWHLHRSLARLRSVVRNRLPAIGPSACCSKSPRTSCRVLAAISTASAGARESSAAARFDGSPNAARNGCAVAARSPTTTRPLAIPTCARKGCTGAGAKLRYRHDERQAPPEWRARRRTRSLPGSRTRRPRRHQRIGQPHHHTFQGSRSSRHERLRRFRASPPDPARRQARPRR